MTANQFRKFLRRHGWTAHQFHRMTGIPRANVYYWLKHGVPRPADNLLLEYIDRYPGLLEAED